MAGPLSPWTWSAAWLAPFSAPQLSALAIMRREATALVDERRDALAAAGLATAAEEAAREELRVHKAEAERALQQQQAQGVQQVTPAPPHHP